MKRFQQSDVFFFVSCLCEKQSTQTECVYISTLPPTPLTPVAKWKLLLKVCRETAIGDRVRWVVVFLKVSVDIFFQLKICTTFTLNGVDEEGLDLSAGQFQGVDLGLRGSRKVSPRTSLVYRSCIYL